MGVGWLGASRRRAPKLSASQCRRHLRTKLQRRVPGAEVRRCPKLERSMSRINLHPPKHKPFIKNGRTPPTRDPRASMPIDHSFAARAGAFVFWLWSHHLIAVAALCSAPNRPSHCPPRRIVPGPAWCQRMGDLVQNRFADFLFVV